MTARRGAAIAHGLKSVERNVLGFSGVAPIEETLIGGVGDNDPAARTQCLSRLAALGREGGQGSGGRRGHSAWIFASRMILPHFLDSTLM